MTTDILTVTDLKKYFVTGHTGWPQRAADHRQGGGRGLVFCA